MNLQENIIRIKEVMGIYTSDQNIIVEASKKEILIDKLGFSNENAEVLANAAGPFSVWLGNKLINDGAFEYSKEYLLALSKKAFHKLKSLEIIFNKLETFRNNFLFV